MRTLPARYLMLLRVQVRAALLLSMQYRFDFFVQAGTAIFWTATAVVPLVVVFHERDGVAGWTWPEALVVVGIFTLLKGLIQGAIQPALTNVVEHVRKGTLDFLLLKPADAQFLVSTSKLELTNVAHVFSGLAILVYAFVKRGAAPDPADVLLALIVMCAGISILYSMWILAVSMAFYFVRIDNLSHLIGSTYDAARWPSSVFRGAFAFAFTFVIPLALMTTYPAMALLGRIHAGQVLLAATMALVFLGGSRMAWMRSIRRYTSAGG